MTAIPFLINDACAGFAHCHGLVRDEGDALVVECQTEDSIAGVIKTDVQEMRIPLSDIAAIAMERSWFGLSNKLVVQLVTMKQTSHLPGMKQGKFVLPVARRDAAAAQTLVASVVAYLNKRPALSV